MMTSGGHEIHEPEAMSDKILHVLDSLEKELTPHELVQKENQEADQSLIELKQQVQDGESLERARDELSKISPENQIQ